MPYQTLATSAVAALLIIGASGSSTGAANGPGGPSDVDTVLISGEVLSANGSPVTLTVSLWPSQDALDALPEGAEVPLQTVADVAVRGNRYTARLDPAKISARYRSAGGAVDVEVTASDGYGNTDTYSETIQAADRGWQRSTIAKEKLAQLSTPRAERPGNLAVGSSGETASMAEADSVQVMMEPICSTNKTTNTHNHVAKVSDVMPAVNYMTGRVTYSIGSSHELGIAVKSPDGSVSEGGTLKRSSSETVSPAYKGYDHTARTTWQWRDYKNSCTGNISARPESHIGGYTTVERTRPSYTYCREYEPQHPWSRSTETAWTYQAGATVFGLNVNTQVGYTTTTKLQYDFDRNRWLCGNDAYPTMSKLVAGYATKQ